MYSITMIVEKERTGDTREVKLRFDTKEELENMTANPEALSDTAYDLFIRAEKDNIFDPVEDDGDTYNGDTDKDLQA